MSTNSSLLEDLPNELLQQILLKLSPAAVLHSWWNINRRFNRLILSLPITGCLKGRNVPRNELQAIQFFREQVLSLIITKHWCEIIKLFANLRDLKIIGYPYPYSSSQIKAGLLPRLTHIQLEDHDPFEWDDFMSADNHHYGRQFVRCQLYKLFKTPTVPCLTLRSVRFLCCTSEALAALLQLAPNLTYMNIGLFTPISLEGYRIVSIVKTTEENEHPSFTPTPSHHFEGIQHLNLRRLQLSFDCQTTLKWLDSFLPCVPNLTHFSLSIDRSYDVFSFVEFHRIMTNHLPKLTQHHFRFQYCCLPTNFNLEQHRRIGPLFKNMIAPQIKSGPMRLLCISVNWPEET